MKQTLKRRQYDNQLPPAQCTTDMLQSVHDLARQNQTSASSIIRHAVSIFLEREARKSSQKLVKQSEN